MVRIRSMPEPLFFLIFPVIGALVGWVTNRLAILMLFRPRQPVNIMGVRIQGLIPKRHNEMAHRIAETVERELLTSEDLGKAMGGVQWEGEIRSTLNNILHKKGPGIIIGRIPGIARAWEAVILPQILEVLTPEINRIIGRYQDNFIDKLRHSVDIRQIVAERIVQFETEALEGLVFTLAKREFKHIELIGALTGAIIGVVQGFIVILLG